MNCIANCTTNITTSYTFQSFVYFNIWMYTINVLFGLPLQFYVIYLIIAGTGSGITPEFFFLNLSVCEIGISFFCLFLTFDYFSFSQQIPYLKDFGQFLQGFCITGRPVFQTLMCFERYLAVVHPVTFLKFKPLRYKLMSSGVVWLMVLGSCVFSMFYLIPCSSGLYKLFYLPQFLVCLCFQLFCCVVVLRVLKQSGPGERGRGREDDHMKRRAFYLILITTVSMFITYTPFILSGFFLLYSGNIFEELWTLSFICFISGGFVLPVLYLKRTGKIFCLLHVI